MRDTSNYKTKTNYVERDNKSLSRFWISSVDVGYSGAKFFSPNCYGRFPDYAVRIKTEPVYIGETPKNAIVYKDLETGDMWAVGELAQNSMSDYDTSDTEESLYGRSRYYSAMYKVLVRTSLGMTCRSNSVGSVGDRKIKVIAGLPEEYMSDTDALIDVFEGGHDFAIKIGDGNWEDFHIALSREDVLVISQPKAALFSVCTGTEGAFTAEARSILESNSLVFDAGFGTLDVFAVCGKQVVQGFTFSDLGMKRILQETVKLIKANYNIDISVPAMQSHLASGTVTYFDRKTLTSKEYAFGDLLSSATVRVCEEAISRVTDAIDITKYKNLIIAGGTGAAWYNYICDKFSGMSTLTVIPGNKNDNIPFVYAISRGLYYYLYNILRKEEKEGKA